MLYCKNSAGQGSSGKNSRKKAPRENRDAFLSDMIFCQAGKTKFPAAVRFLHNSAGGYRSHPVDTGDDNAGLAVRGMDHGTSADVDRDMIDRT